MNATPTYFLAIDYQDPLTESATTDMTDSFKKAGRKLADDLRLYGIETIWTIMVPDRVRSMMRPLFISSNERCPGSFNEDMICYQCSFDPDQARADEGIFLKLQNSCLGEKGNPVLDALFRKHERVAFVIAGRETSRCITSTLIDGTNNARIERCDVIVNCLGDIDAETSGPKPPVWHQRLLSANPHINQSKAGYWSDESFLRHLAKKAAL